MTTSTKKTERKLQKAAPANFNAGKFIAAKGSKSEAIRSLLKDGYSRGDVAQLLGLRYQHVRNVEITPIKTPKAPSSTVKPTDEEFEAEFGSAKK